MLSRTGHVWVRKFAETRYDGNVLIVYFAHQRGIQIHLRAQRGLLRLGFGSRTIQFQTPVVVEELRGVHMRIDPDRHHYDEVGLGLRNRFGEGRDSQQTCGERCIAHELFSVEMRLSQKRPT